MQILKQEPNVIIVVMHDSCVFKQLGNFYFHSDQVQGQISNWSEFPFLDFHRFIVTVFLAYKIQALQGYLGGLPFTATLLNSMVVNFKLQISMENPLTIIPTNGMLCDIGMELS